MLHSVPLDIRNAIFHKEECSKDKELNVLIRVLREYSCRKRKESVIRFSEKNEVFFELYVRSHFLPLSLFFFFLNLFLPVITIYDISLYVRALLLYIPLSSVFSFHADNIAFNIYNLYLSVL